MWFVGISWQLIATVIIIVTTILIIYISQITYNDDYNNNNEICDVAAHHAKFTINKFIGNVTTKEMWYIWYISCHKLNNNFCLLDLILLFLRRHDVSEYTALLQMSRYTNHTLIKIYFILLLFSFRWVIRASCRFSNSVIMNNET